MKYVGRLVDQEVIEAARFAKVGGRQVAGRPFAEAQKAGCFFGKELRVDAFEIEIRQVPGRAEPRHLREYCIDCRRREKDERAAEYVEDGLLFVAQEQSPHHGRHLPPRQGNDVQIRQRFRGRSVRGPLANCGYQRLTQSRAAVLGARHIALPRPCQKLGIVVATAKIPFDCLFRRFRHGGHPIEGAQP